MATNDIRSQLVNSLPFNMNLSSNGTTLGQIIDTSRLIGLMFTVNFIPYTDGTHILTMFDDDDIGFASPVLIPDANIIGTIPVLDFATPESNDPTPTWGVFGNKRFIRITVVSTGTSGVGNFLNINLVGKKKTVPVSEP